jgi:DNA-binding transcriptional LysR family regulator
LDVRGLQALVTVADSGSFRSAAMLLGYTQSAISHQIAELEESLGAKLFERPGGRARVTLTAAGSAAYISARRTLGELRLLRASVRAADTAGPAILRVGVFASGAAELLPTALRLIRDGFPGVEVVLTEVFEEPRLADWLADGRLDLALSLNREPDDRIELIYLFEDPWVILTRRDSDLARSARVTFEMLDGRDVVAWTSGSEMQRDLENALRRRGVSPKVIYRSDDNLVIQRLVAMGLGHALLGRMAARRAVDPLLTWLEPPDILSPRTVVLCHPRGRELSDAARALSEALHSEFAQ